MSEIEDQGKNKSETGKVKGLSEAYSDIDIGLSLYDIEEESTRLTTKPSTKLSAWASFGIPAVLSYQKSYDPYVKKYPFLQELIVDSLDLEAAMSIVLKLSKFHLFRISSCSITPKPLKGLYMRGFTTLGLLFIGFTNGYSRSPFSVIWDLK